MTRDSYYNALRRLVHWGRDLREEWYRRFPGPHRGKPRYNLMPLQVYPNGSNIRALFSDIARTTLRGLHLNNQSAVVSIGSCFAEEISRKFRDGSYNYRIVEPNFWGFSAAWGRVWTIPNLAQIIDYSLDLDYPLHLLETDEGFFDPLREMETLVADQRFETDRAAAHDRLVRHRQASRQAFAEADIIFITLGQNEATRDLKSGLVWARRPPKGLKNTGDFDFVDETFSFETNRDLLRSVITRLLAFNRRVSIILTVSPVAAAATFFDDSVVTRSFGNKCLLRTVATEMTTLFPERVGYFPSFEIALAENRGNFQSDNRHVKYATVNRIFDALVRAVS